MGRMGAGGGAGGGGSPVLYKDGHAPSRSFGAACLGNPALRSAPGGLGDETGKEKSSCPLSTGCP